MKQLKMRKPSISRCSRRRRRIKALDDWKFQSGDWTKSTHIKWIPSRSYNRSGKFSLPKPKSKSFYVLRLARAIIRYVSWATLDKISETIEKCLDRRMFSVRQKCWIAAVRHSVKIKVNGKLPLSLLSFWQFRDARAHTHTNETFENIKTTNSKRVHAFQKSFENYPEIWLNWIAEIYDLSIRQNIRFIHLAVELRAAEEGRRIWRKPSLKIHVNGQMSQRSFVTNCAIA